MAFFASFNSIDLRFMPKLDDVFGLYTKMLLGIGIVFQMPTVVFFLAKMRMVTARFLARHFKYALLLIFIVAAVITPTGDPMTQTIFAAPMIVLYGISIIVAWMVGPKRIDLRGLTRYLQPQAAARRVELRRTYTSTPKFVVIRASSGKEVDALVGDLSSPSAVARDGAVARLTVIGARAVQRLLDVARTAAASPVGAGGGIPRARSDRRAAGPRHGADRHLGPGSSRRERGARRRARVPQGFARRRASSTT